MKLRQSTLSYEEIISVINELQFKRNEDLHNAMIKMLHNEISELSFRELQSLAIEENLYEKFSLINSPLLLSILLKHKIQWECFSEYSQWIVSVIDKPTDNLYNLIHKIETKINKDDKNKNAYFIDFIHNYCFFIDTDEKKKLIEHFYNDWIDKLEEDIVHLLIQSAPTSLKRRGKKDEDKKENIYHFYLDKFKAKDFDIKRFNVNSLLPIYDGITPFSISLISLEKIKFLSNYNLFINDETYSFGGKTLYENIMGKYLNYYDNSNKEIFDFIVTQIYNFTTQDETLNEKICAILDYEHINQETKSIIFHNKTNHELKTKAPIRRKVNKI